MPIRHAIWKVSEKPQQLKESLLASEQLLEKMILASPRLLSDEWMFIGQQEDTGYGGRIDLLAIAPDASLVLIELKRHKTPREVVAQALDYATWVEKLKSEDIAAIYGRFAQGHSLADDFKERFGQPLDEEMLNQNHQIIIVAAEIDESSERIISYLNERDIPINVLCFQVFENDTDQFISRAWLLDPVHTQINAAGSVDRQREPWNGEFYASFGHGDDRSWDEAVKYGFLSAGGGSWYSKTLNLLSPGDLIWVKAPGYGFVGVGRVKGKAEAASVFKIQAGDDERLAVEVLKNGNYHKQFLNDPERCEYFVPVEWIETLPLEDGIKEVGLFGNKNTVCRPTDPKWRSTVERLRTFFLKAKQTS